MEPQNQAFRPQVTKAKPRLRLGFVVALLLAMAAGVATLLYQRIGHDERRPAPAPGFAANGCTALAVTTTIKNPNMTEGQRAVCLAIAGRIDDARARLTAMWGEQRMQAINAVFTIAHPIADAGDDRSAGPIMELVVEFWPDNYMAVFHAGMAEYALGEDVRAQAQLQRFLTMYANQDVWRQRAQSALVGISAKTPLDQREAHFAE